MPVGVSVEYYVLRNLFLDVLKSTSCLVALRYHFQSSEDLIYFVVSSHQKVSLLLVGIKAKVLSL
jgi:hypothetical protein